MKETVVGVIVEPKNNNLCVIAEGGVYEVGSTVKS